MALVSSEFFILRASRFSQNDYSALYESVERSSALFTDPPASIIKVSSRDVFSAMKREFKNGRGCLSPKTEASALRTIMRASFRATPYRLSSTTTLGSIGNFDDFDINHQHTITANIGISGEALSLIIDSLNRANISDKSAILRLNPTKYMIGDRVRFISTDSKFSGAYKYAERDVTKSDVLVFSFLKEPRRLREIAAYLDALTDFEEGYLQENLTSGLIIPDLAMPIHGRDGINFLVSYLQTNHPELEQKVQILLSLKQQLAESGNGTSLTETERADHIVGSAMAQLGIQTDEVRSLLLIDPILESPNCIMSSATAKRLLRSVNSLIQKTFRPTLLHERFARKISERFGDEAIPVGYLADPKYGISLAPELLTNFPAAEASARYEKELTSFLIDALADRTETIDFTKFHRFVDPETMFLNWAVLAQIRQNGDTVFNKALSRLIFIDETSTNTRLTKRTGWSAKGSRFAAYAPFGHWKTQTFIAGLRCHGLTAPWIVDAPMNSRIFETWIETQLAPTMSASTKARKPNNWSRRRGPGFSSCRPIRLT